MMKKAGLDLLIAAILILSLASLPAQSEEKNSATGPYDSLRDYIDALEQHGRLLRIDRIDQDKYEATALMYRMLDKLGDDKAPAVLFENIKINGKWVKGPVLVNAYPGWDAAAMIFGAKEINKNSGEMYRAARDVLVNSVGSNGGKWRRIKPVKLEAEESKKAPCKEVILKGDDVDILSFPWFKNNPKDVSQYINTGNVFMEDAKFGRNVGTYRIQVKGKNKVGVNTEPGQHGWRFMMTAKGMGQHSVPAAIVVGADPIVFSMSSTKVADFGEDELEFAGGLMGKPIKLVKCETSDILVPANAEIVIEGDIITEEEDEGPYGEMFGYMGKQHKNWYMEVKAITHRKNPVFVNNFTGIVHPSIMIPWSIGSYIKLKSVMPYLVDMYNPRELTGISILSISKRFPGMGINAGQLLLSTTTSKIAIVVDDDIDVTNLTAVLQAVSTRWQPYPASLIIPQTFSMNIDPSMAQRGITSKIVIDATRRQPIEGGPEEWPAPLRKLLEDNAPESFTRVDENWNEYFKGWRE